MMVSKEQISVLVILIFVVGGAIGDLIDTLPGEEVEETNKGKEEEVHRTCRVIIGMIRDRKEHLNSLYSINKDNFKVDSVEVQKQKRKIVESFRQQLITGIPTKEDELALQLLLKQLKEEKVCVKLFLKYPLHAKLYLAHRPTDKTNPIQALLGSSNLTFSGLEGQGELDTEIPDRDNAKKLSEWFEDRWNERYCIDVTNELIDVLENSWASGKMILPYFIYLKTAYHLCQESRCGMNEYELPEVFHNELFDFQQTAVKLAARHLDKRGGAMIGDVVGLGKTITACAVAKLYEMRHACSTLILCPANLTEMWEGYVKKYDLKADVMSVSKNFDSKKMRYYKLIVVDESHNLRNSNGKRYQNIRELVEFQGCKVLLLTATPYNKQYMDLSNQLKLFIPEDADLGISPENYIKQIGGQHEYSMRHGEDHIRSIKAFEHSTDVDDWQNLMRLFLVRRTRSFIKANYAKTDSTNGRKYLQFSNGTTSYFPDRIPKAIKFKTIGGDQYSRLYSEKMLDFFSELTLPRYGLCDYIDSKKTENIDEYDKEVLNNLTKAGKSMIGFCRSMFMKRLDSCGISFLISVYRHILRNTLFLYAIDNGLELPVGDEGELPENFLEDMDFEGTALFTQDTINSEKTGIRTEFPIEFDKYYEIAKTHYQTMDRDTKKISWISSKYFKKSLKQKLKSDCDILINMLALCGTWDASADKKLDALEDLITKTHGNDKCLIFTQFSDTAEYVAKQLKLRGITNCEYVSGDTENITSYVTRFSPVSNKENIAEDNQIRILVATDVLSEGQNLQDGHVIINFDLPWAIIRLIQRAGRVDRIGQISDKIYCYSFFPADGIEDVIKLRNRLNTRINENAQVVGGDEIFFEGNEQNLKDLYNEKSGVLDEEDGTNGEVDLASEAYQIWKNATDANPQLKEIIPRLNNVVYSAKVNNSEAINEGIITYAKTPDGNDILTWMDKNKKIVTQSQKKILDSMACGIDEEAIESLSNHHEIVAEAVKKIQSSEFKTSGILGNRFSTKYQVFTRLNALFESNLYTLFIDQNKLKAALDDIYNFPLKETSKTVLGSAVRTNASTERLAELVIDMYDNNELCIKKEEDYITKDPQIICSMGLINKD